MPELPEVETIRRDLQSLMGKTIQSVLVLRKEYIRSGSERMAALVGGSFQQIARHGKLLIATLPKDFLLFHLGMTGRLVADSFEGGYSRQNFPKHTHVIIEFTDRTRLRIQDVRRFGYLKLVNATQLQKILDSFGPDAWNDIISATTFYAQLKTHHTTLKSFLLNQQYIAGLGNIYVDEICFASRIKPTRMTFTISKKESETLIRCMKDILQQAIQERGTSFRDYVDSQGRKGNFVSKLFVYGRGKDSCRVCHTPLTQQLIAQRTTVFCRSCQK